MDHAMSSHTIIEERAASDQRIRFIFKQNGGQASALNAAYAECTGEIVVLMDSDDVFHSSKIAEVVKHLQLNPNGGIAAHFVRPIDEVGRVVGPPIPHRLFSGWWGPWSLAHGGYHSGFPPTSGIALRRKLADSLFPIPVDFVISPDGYIRGLGIFITNIIAIPHYLGGWRVHGNNASGTRPDSLHAYEINLRGYRQVLEEQKHFLANAYGSSLAAKLSLDDLDEYRHNLLAYHYLSGVWPSFDSNRILKQLIRTFPYYSIGGAMWRLLFRIPRSISGGLFYLWQARYPLKRFISRVVRRGRSGVVASP
jgi:glycosyltransferase involved in cell wall biosynthesis